MRTPDSSSGTEGRSGAGDCDGVAVAETDEVAVPLRLTSDGRGLLVAEAVSGALPVCDTGAVTLGVAVPLGLRVRDPDAVG